jgi:hypothetical protein
MKILFDNGVPRPIARCLTGHEITYARRIGWHELGNGELIRRAEDAGYEVLLSTDKNIRYQQNLQAGKSRSSFSETSNGRWCGCISIK